MHGVEVSVYLLWVNKTKNRNNIRRLFPNINQHNTYLHVHWFIATAISEEHSKANIQALNNR